MKPTDSIAIESDAGDRRRRLVTLTAKGLSERGAYDALSDDLAQSLLDSLNGTQRRGRLVAAMAEVERLMNAAAVVIAAEPEDSRDARHCVAAYFKELDERFDGGFDPDNGGYAGKPATADASGTFLIARLHGRVTLYLFSAVVGSVICTNALCFEAERVRVMLQSGDRLWRILVSKNLAMAAMVTLAGLPVIGLLSVTADVNPVAMVDQLVTMVFIWLGVGNVLSVVAPLRHEPVSARLSDGTWKPYLLSFAVSYGVGLSVNLMIYWRLWAKQKASAELAGGTWAAFTMVLASAVLSWLLLTVFAVACSRETALRRRLSREMVAYRKSG